jgi:hypothetical protein
MRDRLNDAAAGGHSLGGQPPRRPRSRTAAAGSEFLKALGSDLAVLAARLPRSLLPINGPQARAAQTAVATPGVTSWGAASGQAVGRLMLGIIIIAV